MQYAIEGANASLPREPTATVVNYVISCAFSSKIEGLDAKINTKQAEMKESAMWIS